MRTYLFCLFIPVALLLSGCNRAEKHAEIPHEGEKEPSDEIHFTPEQARTIGLQTETISSGTFQEVIITSGQILPAPGDEMSVVATSNGVVRFSQSSVSEGLAVRAGQTLATISAKDLLDGDPAEKARLAYVAAQKEYERSEKLVKDNIISAKEFEQVKLRFETARSGYGVHTAGEVRIKFPISGYLKNLLVEQGAYVAVGQPIATVSQNRKLQLKADVPESSYKELENIGGANFKPAGSEVVYKLSDLKGRLLSYGKSTDGSFYLPITFELYNVGELVSGSYAEVYLLGKIQQGVISVPVSSVVEEQGLFFVYLQLDEEGYKKQEVTLGQNNGERIRILTGLKSGDRVVTKGVYQVKLAASSSVVPEGHSHSH
jgi:membrane fusion protein, heavy metal efflux system